MATGLDIGIELLETIFFKTSFAGQYWIGQLVIIVATLALITRRTSDWKTLALPVMVGWKYFGMNMNWMFYAVAGVMFVVDAMSIQMIQSAIGAVSETIGYTKLRGGIRGAYREGKLRTEKRRMDIKREMANIKLERDYLDTELKSSRYDKMMGMSAKEELMKQKLEGGHDRYKVIGMSKQGDPIVISNLAKLGKITEDTIIKSQMREGLRDQNLKDNWNTRYMKNAGIDNKMSKGKYKTTRSKYEE